MSLHTSLGVAVCGPVWVKCGYSAWQRSAVVQLHLIAYLRSATTLSPLLKRILHHTCSITTYSLWYPVCNKLKPHSPRQRVTASLPPHRLLPERSHLQPRLLLRLASTRYSCCLLAVLAVFMAGSAGSSWISMVCMMAVWQYVSCQLTVALVDAAGTCMHEAQRQRCMDSNICILHSAFCMSRRHACEAGPLWGEPCGFVLALEQTGVFFLPLIFTQSS